MNHRISQFADDTTIFAKDYNDARHIWPILDLYESATGMRGNTGKFLGIQMGSLKKKNPPDDFGLPGFTIEPLADGQFGKLLGVPFCKNAGEEEEDPFWRGLYRKIKTRMASWSTKSFLTVHGRVQLANLICYGIPRYWAQSMCPPTWFNKELNEDVAKLIWDREIEFDPEEDVSTKDTIRWIKQSSEHLPCRINKKGEGLGLGLLDWNSHCAAISVSWLLKYRDATDAPWKNVLDLWFSNTILDRGAAFSSLSFRELTAHLDPRKAKRGDKSSLSYFWKSALTALKDNLQLAPIEINTSRWGTGYIHAKRYSYPVASEFTFEGDKTPLDRLTIKKLTYLISKRNSIPPTCIKNRPKTLAIGEKPFPPWNTIAALYSNAFSSSKDYHLHYKHIIHRAIVTRHTWPAMHGPLCRLCQSADERTFHKGSCPVIKDFFKPS
jgi:hypothetical protein